MINRRMFCRKGILIACGAGSGALPATLRPQTHDQVVGENLLRVGATRAVKTLASAARIARHGTVIEVDAGNYAGDTAVWEHDGVTVRATGGRVRLMAQGASAEGKAIWVVRARSMRVDGFDFEGTAVADRNGAGIRLEKGSLDVRDCRFLHNEMGLMTSNNPTVTLHIENCEFAHNQRPDGHNHNLYVGQIARVTVIGSYFHHARTGHLLKSRAAVSLIYYNRLTDEAGGSASYELEFPNGGIAFVVGNLIGQGTQTDNEHLISFGAEGYKWPRNTIHLVNNTLVNALPSGGVFLRVAPGANTIRAINNLLLGPGALQAAGKGDYRNNFKAEPIEFVQPAEYDYRLRVDSHLIGLAANLTDTDDQEIRPVREYVHPRHSKPLFGAPHNPGAFQSIASAPSS